MQSLPNILASFELGKALAQTHTRHILKDLEKQKSVKLSRREQKALQYDFEILFTHKGNIVMLSKEGREALNNLLQWVQDNMLEFVYAQDNKHTEEIMRKYIMELQND